MLTDDDAALVENEAEDVVDENAVGEAEKDCPALVDCDVEALGCKHGLKHDETGTHCVIIT